MRRALVALLLMNLCLGELQAQQSLGRLFFTPAERARMDAARDDAIANANKPKVVAPVEAPRVPAARIMTLNGIVRRSDGETTVWVNGKAVGARSASTDITPTGVGRESAGFTLQESGRRVRLKVGQTVEATSGVIEESYARRRTLPVAGGEAAPQDAGDPATSAGTAPAEESPVRDRSPRSTGPNGRS